MTDLTVLRERHMARAHELAPEVLARLQWDAATLAEYRRRALRELIAYAVDRSPWHRRRLHAVDLDSLDPEDLTALPTMTKHELMADFDEIVTDDRLRLSDVDTHLENTTEGGYLFDEYTAMATGGSTGRRSIAVFDRDGLAMWWLSFFRRLLMERDTDPELAGAPVTVAWVAASHPSHASATMARTFNDPGLVNLRFPVTMPIAQIVDGLNEARPKLLFSYPSMLHLLAGEAAAGRLRIAPVQVWVAGEPLLPEIRAAAEQAWGRCIANIWGATEIGAMAVPCRLGGSHLGSDFGIVETVDAAGRPVPPGQRSTKILVTNLFNRAMPMIRYEISDELLFLPDPCPCGEPTPCIADVQGRMDDSFVYDECSVHPHVFRSTLGRCAPIIEYQVRQTERGAEVLAVCAGEVDLAAVAGDLVSGLCQVGLTDPQVTVRQVDRVGRLEHTGKLKRFVALTPAGVPA